MGEATVVAKIGRGFGGKQLTLALSWIAAKNQERLLRMEASNSKSLDLAKSANALASKANLIADKALTRATIAAIATIIITAVVVIGFLSD